MSYYKKKITWVAPLAGILIAFQIEGMEHSFIDYKAKKSASHQVVHSSEVITPPLSLKIKAHESCIHSVALSCDGKVIFTGSRDKTAGVWDACTGNQRTMTIRKECISVVACSCDGSTVFVASCDGKASLSDSQTGKLRCWLEGHTGYVTAAVFSSDDKTVVAGLSDGTVVIWNTQTGKLVGELKEHVGETDFFWNSLKEPYRENFDASLRQIHTIACSPRSTVIFTGSKDGTSVVWDYSTGEKLKIVETGSHSVTSAVFSLDGTTLYMGVTNGEVMQLNTVTKQCKVDSQWYKKPISSIALSADGTILTTCFEDSSGFFLVSFSNVERGELLGTGKVPSSLSDVAVVSSDGNSLLIGSHEGLAYLYSFKEQREELLKPVQKSTRIAKSKAQDVFFLENKEDIIKKHPYPPLKNLDPFQCPKAPLKIKAHRERINTVAISSNRKCMFTGSPDRTACAWETSTGNQLTMAIRKESISSVACSSDGSTVFIGSCDGTASLLNSETGKLSQWLKGNTGYVTAAAFSPNDTTLLAGLSDGNIILWNTTTGQLVVELKEQSGFSSTGGWYSDDIGIPTESEGDDLCWSSIRSQDKVKPRISMKNKITFVAFSPCGTTIFTGSRDGTATLWNSATGKKLGTVEIGSRYVTTAVFSCDGSTLFMGLSDGGIIRVNTLTRQHKIVSQWHKKRIRSIALGLSDTVIITCSEGSPGFFLIAFWSFKTGERLLTHNEPVGLSSAAALTGDGSFIVIGSDKGIVNFCSLTQCLQRLPKQAQLSSALSEFHAQELRRKEYLRSASKDIIGNNEHHRKSSIELKGHAQGFTAAEFSWDGKLILTGSDEGTVSLWDASTGKHLKTLKQHTSRISSLACCGSKDMFVTGSDDTTACVWKEGELAQVLKGHTKGITAVACSSDGKAALTGSCDATVRLWDTTTGKCRYIVKLKGHTEAVMCVGFNSTGEIFLTGSLNGTVVLWEVKTGRKLKAFKLEAGLSSPVLFNAEGTTLLAGLSNGKVILWDSNTSKLIVDLKGYRTPVCVVAYSADGSTISSGARDDMRDSFVICLWDSKTGEQLATYKESAVDFPSAAAFNPECTTVFLGSSDGKAHLCGTRGPLAWSQRALEGYVLPISKVAWSPDGTKILTGSGEKIAYLWESSTGNLIHILEGHTGSISALVFSPDGKNIVTGSSDSTIRLWNAEKGWCKFSLKEHTKEVHLVSFSSDSTIFFTGSLDGTVCVWDVETGRLIQKLVGHSKKVTSMALDSSENSMLTGSTDCTVTLWDVQAKKIREVFKIDSGFFATTVGFIPNGRIFFAGLSDGRVLLWDTDTRELLWTFKEHETSISSVILHPDSSIMITASHDGAACVWDVTTGQLQKKFKGHKGPVTCLSYAPASKIVFTGSWDTTVLVWNVETRELIRELRGHTKRISAIACSHDEKTVFTASLDGTVFLWDIPSLKSEDEKIV